jgi:hypothetical protein
MLEMRIVIQAVVDRYELSPASPGAERTGRRSITFSPSEGASVILHRRQTSVPEAQERQALAQIA